MNRGDKFTIEEFDFLMKNSKGFREAYDSLMEDDELLSDEMRQEIDDKLKAMFDEKK